MATDLHEAAQRGDVAALRRLLDGGAAIVAKDIVRPAGCANAAASPARALGGLAGWRDAAA